MMQVTRLPMEADTPVTVGRNEAFTWRYIYCRSRDSAVAGTDGQDCLVFGADKRTFVFALCDGVSQSFRGDLAARLVGEALVRWLLTDIQSETDKETASASLIASLRSLVGPATDAVEGSKIPNDVHPNVRRALEQKREYGSETVFACGRIDLPTSERESGHLVMAWMGNVRLRIWAESGEELSPTLGAQLRDVERWSSLLGPKGGLPHVFITTLTWDSTASPSRMVAYSDGLEDYDHLGQSLTNQALDELIGRAHNSPLSDDITYLELWVGSMPDRLATLPLESPVLVSATVSGDRMRPAWELVPGADRYQIQVQSTETYEWDITDVEYGCPPLPPGTYRLRVKAFRGDDSSEWSLPYNAEITRAPQGPGEGASPLEELDSGGGRLPTAPYVEQFRQGPGSGMSATPDRRRIGVAIMISGWAVALALLTAILLTFPSWGPLHTIVLPSATAAATPAATTAPPKATLPPTVSPPSASPIRTPTLAATTAPPMTTLTPTVSTPTPSPILTPTQMSSTPTLGAATLTPTSIQPGNPTRSHGGYPP